MELDLTETPLPARGDAKPGPGLGPAIARSIIDAHHGSVHVESEPGIGTTVRLTLPKP